MIIQDAEFSALHSDNNLSSNAKGEFIFPEGFALFRADFIRDGSDLLVRSADGNGLRLSDYFLDPIPADLLSHDGAVLKGHIIQRLAGPPFPAQYAQVGGIDLEDAIGQVEVLEGTANVQRTDGQTVELEVGVKVFAGDVVQTQDGSTLALTFADGTIFTLAAASRMVLDELIYDPQGSDNSGIFNLVEGSFVFIAGQTARTGGIEINTPAATMGIRGTTGKIDIQTVNGIATVSVSLNPDPDGGLGLIQLFDLEGNLISNIAATDTKWIIRPPFTNEPPIEIARNATDFADDADLLSQAAAAFQLALTRVQNGETFVELPEGSQLVPQDLQEEESDLEDGPGLRPPALDEAGEGGGPGGPGRGNPELDGSNRPSIQQENGKEGVDEASLIFESTEDTPLTSQLPFTGAGGNVVEVSLSRGAENGLVVLASDGTFTYTPNANFEGQDTFEVTGIDETGAEQKALVTVIVDPVNDAPVASDDDNASTDEDTPVTISVLSNDSDVDSDTLSVDSVTNGSNGTVVNNANGTVTYTPNADFNGTDSFTYTVSDGNGGTDTATVTVNVGVLNDAPAANTDNATTVEDTPVTISVLSNDSDVDSDTLSVDSVTNGSNGTVVINANGTVTYTPNADFNGIDSFTYTVSDGNGGTDTATVTVNVGVLNDAPVANTDSASTVEDTPVTISVLSNDSDLDGDTLSVDSATNGSNGTVVINANGTVTYTPNADFNGTDSFTYTVSDGKAGTDTATVNITVNTVNDAPVANTDSASTVEDTPVTISVLSNDSDLDSDTLSVDSVTNGSNGTVVNNANGTVTYTPYADFNGTDSFTYTVSDGNGGTDTATVNITVNTVNDAPVANTDNATTVEDTPVTISVLSNDSDLDSDTLSVDSVTNGSNGTVVINANGTVTYTPNADFNGIDSFTYTVSDGNGGTDTATVTVNVGVLNDAPVANTDSASTVEDTPVTISVLSNDSDLDGDTLSVDSATNGSNGTVVINANGTVTYTPNADFNGIDSFTYTVSDGKAGTDTATVNITVNTVNDAPVANTDSATTDEDTPVTISVLSNDSDLDSDTLSVDSVTNGSNGTVVSNNTNGTVTYTPYANFNGTDSFTYTVSDGNGGTDTATVNITVNTVNDAPVANTDNATTVEDTPVTISVLSNDSDVDGDTLSVDSVTNGSNGTVLINAIGTVTYTPNADFTGIDSFTYTVSDGNGGTDTATVNITVNTVNDAPVANTDSATTDEDTPVTISVLSNDSDLDGDTLSVDSVTNGSNGTVVSNNTNGTVTYTPNADFNGTDSFTYTVSDGNGGTDTATVNITVNTVNDAPVANTDSATTDEDTPVTISVLSNDSDVDGDTLSVDSVTNGSNGTVVSNNTNGTVTYTPNADFNGTDSFTYTVSDGNGGTDTATVNVDVVPVVPVDLTQAPTERSQLNDSVDVVANGQVQTFTKNVDVGTNSEAMLQLLMKGNYGTGSNAGIEIKIADTVLGTFAPAAEAVDAGVTGQIDDSTAVSGYTGKVLAVEPANGQQFDITWNLNITLSSTFWNSIAPNGEVTVDISLNNEPTVGIPGNDYFFGYRLVYDDAKQDPLVIDLGEDGISFLPDAVNFDLNADGAAERSAWTNGQDGLLVVDLDGSGSIESGQEVFSPFFGEGGFATSLDALATTYDSNGDGVVDSDDAGFGDILIWIDTNVDGVSDTNELRSLGTLGIEEIDLAVERSDTLINGQIVTATGNVTFADGTTRDYVEVTFVDSNTDEVTYTATGLTFTVADSADNKALEIGKVDQAALVSNDEIIEVDLGAIHEMASDLLAEINAIDMANGQKNALIVDADDLLRLIDGNTADANEAIEIKMDVFDTASVKPSDDWTLKQVDQDTLQLEGSGGEFAALGTFATITFVSEETNQA